MRVPEGREVPHACRDLGHLVLGAAEEGEQELVVVARQLLSTLLEFLAQCSEAGNALGLVLDDGAALGVD